MADTQISCIRFVPYKQYADGTSGSILVVGWHTDRPSVFLFDSVDRKRDAPNTARNILLPQEADMYAQYLKEETGQDNPRETYARYGVVRLAGQLVSAHIADMICENLNSHDSRNQRKADRTKNLLGEATDADKAKGMEEELLFHLSDNSEWVRSFLEQTLPLIASGYNHRQWLQTTLDAVRKAAEDRGSTYKKKEEKGIKAVLESGICRTKSDWGAVFRILAERKIIARTSYLAGARIINQVCGEEVTTASAIKQSPALVIIGGTIVRGWTDKKHNRQSANLLIHYRKIAETFLKGEEM